MVFSDYDVSFSCVFEAVVSQLHCISKQLQSLSSAQQMFLQVNIASLIHQSNHPTLLLALRTAHTTEFGIFEVQMLVGQLLKMKPRNVQTLPNKRMRCE